MCSCGNVWKNKYSESKRISNMYKPGSQEFVLNPDHSQFLATSLYLHPSYITSPVVHGCQIYIWSFWQPLLLWIAKLSLLPFPFKGSTQQLSPYLWTPFLLKSPQVVISSIKANLSQRILSAFLQCCQNHKELMVGYCSSSSLLVPLIAGHFSTLQQGLHLTCYEVAERGCMNARLS